jgi:hypothetical protein
MDTDQLRIDAHSFARLSTGNSKTFAPSLLSVQYADVRTMRKQQRDPIRVIPKDSELQWTDPVVRNCVDIRTMRKQQRGHILVIPKDSEVQWTEPVVRNCVDIRPILQKEFRHDKAQIPRVIGCKMQRCFSTQIGCSDGSPMLQQQFGHFMGLAARPSGSQVQGCRSIYVPNTSIGTVGKQQ